MINRGLARILATAALVAAACSPEGPSLGEPESSTTAAVTTTSATISSASTTTEAPYVHPSAPNGRTYPAVASDQAALAARLYEIERLLHEREPSSGGWADLAHEQQMLYRVIARQREWVSDVVLNAPDEYRQQIGLHLAARQAIAGIGGEAAAPANVPAWEIIEPLPIDDLRELYEQASAETGIDWSYLAAINLMETGFGRIDGLSTAGAQGPMQFLPTTWAEVSDGDIHSPHDAIPAAARYLVRRGGPENMERALWGYNNSEDYVAAVSLYATLFRLDDRALTAAHQWEIHYSAAYGDLWFPVGYRLEDPTPAAEYVAQAPWSAPPPPL